MSLSASHHFVFVLFVAILVIVFYITSPFTSGPHAGPSDIPSRSDSGSLRPRGALVSLARNSDLEAMKRVMRNMEDRFNRKHRYPWVFLNDEPFQERFKQAMSMLTTADVYFEQIPLEHWSYPHWINQTLAAQKRREMEEAGIIYGGSESYRHMCRYNAGFVWKHPRMAQFDFYWRVEPGNVEYFCDMDDKFMESRVAGYKYGFNIAFGEYMATIPTLWTSVRKFMSRFPDLIPQDNALQLLSDDGGISYNGCHFWSNFEIVDLEFYRSAAYETFFSFLDQEGGFFYERWGDAPVHSIAAALFLTIDQIHFWEDIGYKHDAYQNCPINGETNGQCVCKMDDSWNKPSILKDNKCMQKYFSLKRK